MPRLREVLRKHFGRAFLQIYESMDSLHNFIKRISARCLGNDDAHHSIFMG